MSFAVETFIPAKNVKLPIYAMVNPGPHRHPKYPFDTTPAWVGGDNHGFRSYCPETPPYYTIFGDDMPFYDPADTGESYRTFQCINIEFDVDDNGNYTGAAADQWGNFVGPSTLYMPADNGKGLQLIDKDYADKSQMSTSVTQSTGSSCVVSMDGTAFVPFYSRKIGKFTVSILPPIQWHLTIALGATQTSLAYSVTGTRSKFPAMEIYMGTAPLLELSPRDVPFYGPYDGVDAYRSLLTTEQVSASGVVPLTGYGPSPNTDSIKPIIN